MCNCDPGNDENGWHETRCAACLAVESESFAHAIRMAHAWIADRRNAKNGTHE